MSESPVRREIVAQHDELIPLSGLVNLRETTAPRAIQHFDRLRSASFWVQLEGVAQGEAIETVGAIARELLPVEGGYRVRLAGDSEKFLEAGNALAFAYGLAILIVYLVLAAQFESFVHPLTILVAVALSFTGALVTLSLVGWLNDLGVVQVVGTLNIFSKIGLVMLIGLVTKNSILIVEFANQLRGRGIRARRGDDRGGPHALPADPDDGAGDDGRDPADRAGAGRRWRLAGAAGDRRGRRHVLLDAADLLIVPATYVVMERPQLRLRGRMGRPRAGGCGRPRRLKDAGGAATLGPLECEPRPRSGSLLGLVQGLTEFLPVSSSGHLVILQSLLGVEREGVVFEIVAARGDAGFGLDLLPARVAELVVGVAARPRRRAALRRQARAGDAAGRDRRCSLRWEPFLEAQFESRR